MAGEALNGPPTAAIEALVLTTRAASDPGQPMKTLSEAMRESRATLASETASAQEKAKAAALLEEITAIVERIR